MTKSILIIKLGLSETLDDADSGLDGAPSLGDVVRSTPLIPALAELYPRSHITWVTSPQAAPLLDGARGIDRLVQWGGSPDQAPGAKDMGPVDLLINLEKAHTVCAWADRVSAKKRLGFFRRQGQVACREQDGGDRVMSYLIARYNGGPKRPWQSLLLEMIGAPWQNQPYVLGGLASAEPIHDVGLNFAVGGKWPIKAMSSDKWLELARLLSASGLKVSWQRGHRDLREYLNWIGSCRLLVTQDSLGLHAALAMGRRVVGLFGPTSAREVCGYGLAVFISSGSECPQAPCYAERCMAQHPCMETMDLREIQQAVLRDLQDTGRAES